MNYTPEISVIVPVYKVEKYLQQQLTLYLQSRSKLTMFC